MRYFIILACNLFLMHIVMQFFKEILGTDEGKNVIRLLTGLCWYLSAFLPGLLCDNNIIKFCINLIFLFLLTLSYRRAWYLKLLAAFSISVLEEICYLFGNRIFRGLTEDVFSDWQVSAVFSVILFWIIEKVFSIILAKREERQLSFFSVVAALAIPLCSIIILFSVSSIKIGNYITILISACALVICFLAFIMCHYIIAGAEKRAEQKYLAIQNESFINELNRIKETEIVINGIRHDLKNHLIEIKSFAEEGDMEKLMEYVDSLEKDIPSKAGFSNTGQTEIDSLINYLLRKAKNELNSVNVSVCIPTDADISPYQINIMVGNLLENAIRAAKESETKELSLAVKAENGMLFIEIINSYSGILEKRGKHFVSTKKDYKEHGYGLKNVERVVKQNKGKIDFSEDGKYFTCHIMMFL